MTSIHEAFNYITNEIIVSIAEAIGAAFITSVVFIVLGFIITQKWRDVNPLKFWFLVGTVALLPICLWYGRDAHSILSRIDLGVANIIRYGPLTFLIWHFVMSVNREYHRREREEAIEMTDRFIDDTSGMTASDIYNFLTAHWNDEEQKSFAQGIKNAKETLSLKEYKEYLIELSLKKIEENKKHKEPSYNW